VLLNSGSRRAWGEVHLLDVRVWACQWHPAGDSRPSLTWRVELAAAVGLEPTTRRMAWDQGGLHSQFLHGTRFAVRFTHKPSRLVGGTRVVSCSHLPLKASYLSQRMGSEASISALSNSGSPVIKVAPSV
jgi:hypothetical protein